MNAMERSPLSYASSDMTRTRRLFVRAVEKASGIKNVERLYRRWQSELPHLDGTMMTRLLEIAGIELVKDGAAWPPAIRDGHPQIIIANHPFGIPDGIAILSLAEAIGRPYKILINNDLLRIPEMEPYSLAVDFGETRKAMQTNIRTRKEALARLKENYTIVIFPGGGIATADKPFGKAQELPWKGFTAKMILQAKADVLPVFFHGQNSAMFHAVSKIGQFWRNTWLVPEAIRRAKKPMHVTIGAPILYEELEKMGDRNSLTAALHKHVEALGAPHEVTGRRRIKFF
jgi:putative hemolysin